MEANEKRTAKLYREVRLLLGLSQADMADKLGIGQSYLSRIESGHRDPSGEQVIAVYELRNKRLKELRELA